MRHLDDDERRRRIAVRHAIAPSSRVGTPEEATEAVAVLHATEPHTVYLSLAARVDHPTLAEIDRVLYEDRTLVKQLAMRRTLFVFPRDLLTAAWPSASARVAAAERARLAKEIEKHEVAADGAAWVEAAAQAILRRLAGGDAVGAAQLRSELPELAGRSVPGGVKQWDISTPFAPRVLTILGLEGRLMRGRNAGHWRTSRPLWTATETWLGDGPLPPSPLSRAQGYAELIGRYLARFGPATEVDLVWWLGATKSIVRAGLDALDAVEVSLDGGDTGFVLPGDDSPGDPRAGITAGLDPATSGESWAALLPVLDPTTMGWKERDFFLAPDLAPRIFDTNGNGGSTAWWRGRVVGCWVQQPDGKVEVRLAVPVEPDGVAALDQEAARLTSWLDGQVIAPIYKSPLMRELS